MCTTRAPPLRGSVRTHGDRGTHRPPAHRLRRHDTLPSHVGMRSPCTASIRSGRLTCSRTHETLKRGAHSRRRRFNSPYLLEGLAQLVLARTVASDTCPVDESHAHAMDRLDRARLASDRLDRRHTHEDAGHFGRYTTLWGTTVWGQGSQTARRLTVRASSASRHAWVIMVGPASDTVRSPIRGRKCVTVDA